MSILITSDNHKSSSAAIKSNDRLLFATSAYPIKSIDHGVRHAWLLMYSTFTVMVVISDLVIAACGAYLSRSLPITIQLFAKIVIASSYGSSSISKKLTSGLLIQYDCLLMIS